MTDAFLFLSHVESPIQHNCTAKGGYQKGFWAPSTDVATFFPKVLIGFPNWVPESWVPIYLLGEISRTGIWKWWVVTIVLDTGSLQEYIFHSPVREGDTHRKGWLVEISKGKDESEELIPAILMDGLTNRGHPGVLMQYLPVCRTYDHLPKKLTYTSTL